jgi:hypothetical protein
MPKVSFAGSSVMGKLAHVTGGLFSRYLAIAFWLQTFILTAKTLRDVHRIFQSLYPFIEVGPGIIQRDTDDIERVADQDGGRVEEYPNAFS